MKILVVGDVFIDTHTDISDKKINRIGGIFHAVRALSGLSIKSDIAYCATAYMNEHIYKHKNKLNIQNAYHCFNRTGAPGIFLIDHSNELHDNQYDYILPNEENVETITTELSKINFEEVTDALVFPGTFDLDVVLHLLNDKQINIHIDMQYENFQRIEHYHIDTLYISINSIETKRYVEKYLVNNSNWNTVVLKENRGGSKVLTSSKDSYEIPSFLLGSIHSVGVGDVYNASFLVHKLQGYNIEESFLKASYIAALYSNTFHYETFKESLKVLESYIPLKSNGTRVSYDNRKDIHIYIAGPDFKNSKYTLYFDRIFEILNYHNFSAHLPIRENGDGDGKTFNEQTKMYSKDISLLDRCNIMIACGFDNDSGTMAEIGYFKATNKSVILYDPKQDVSNMFIKHSVRKTVHDLDKLLETVYRYAQEVLDAKI